MQQVVFFILCKYNGTVARYMDVLYGLMNLTIIQVNVDSSAV